PPRSWGNSSSAANCTRKACRCISVTNDRVRASAAGPTNVSTFSEGAPPTAPAPGNAGPPDALAHVRRAPPPAVAGLEKRLLARAELTQRRARRVPAPRRAEQPQ